MEPQSQNIKIVSIVVVLVLVVGVGYFLLFGKYNAPGKVKPLVTPSSESQKPAKVVVENTPVVGGTLSAPAGFPQDIPFENSGVLESATTQYLSKNAKQLSVSYKSSKTVAEKYTEYKNYMVKAGYSVTEGAASAPVRSLFGTRTDANLSVAISSSKPDGKTLVQLSYLMTSLK